jgi:hypothetical protein
MDPVVLDTIGLLVGLGITLVIATYLFWGGDNLAYRWGLALVVGVGAGYAFGQGLHYLITWLLSGIEGTRSTLVVVPPVVLGLLLWLKFFPRTSPLGNISMGFLMGVGVAVAISGALVGTLIPQVVATGTAVSLEGGLSALVEGLLVLVGTILALFTFSPRPLPVEGAGRGVLLLRSAGRIFVTMALAAAFANALTTGLTLFMTRFWRIIIILFEGLDPLLPGS